MGDGGYDVARYVLTITYDAKSGVIDADDVVTATATQSLSSFTLDLVGLTVRSVTVGGKPAAFHLANGKLTVTPAAGIVGGATFVADIHYGGRPVMYSDDPDAPEGWMERTGGVIVQGEPQSAASWYPVDDTPRDKAVYDITVTTQTGLSVLSNGGLLGRVVNGATTTWHWAESAPMASYLVMLMIGDYRVATSTHDGRIVVLAVDSSLPTYVDADLAKTPQVLDFLVTQFGPYPFEAIGGVVHRDSGIPFALENQTRPVYAPQFFTAQPDADHTGVLAHELAHQWYGDDVSVASWSDIWLNEGFATYAEWLWSQHQGQRTAKQWFDRYYLQIQMQGGFTDPVAAPPTIAAAFGFASYTGGAMVLEALRIAVGDTTFFKILRGWPVAHEFGNATTADFIAYADQVSGRSLDSFLHPWLYGTGVPPPPAPLGRP